MKLERQTEEMLRLDGWTIIFPHSIYKGYIVRCGEAKPYDFDRLSACGKLHYFDKEITRPDNRKFPDYLNDYNAVHRVLDSLSNRLLYKYEDYSTDLQATAAQMTEAVLRAHGKWEETQ